MKIPRKSIPIALATLFAAFFASATTLAKAPPPKADPNKPELPSYMSRAAGLENAVYMRCIKQKFKSPGPSNLLTNFAVALECQKDES